MLPTEVEKEQLAFVYTGSSSESVKILLDKTQQIK